MAAALKRNSPSIRPEPLHFTPVCFGLSHPAFIIILADVSQRQGNFEPSQTSHREEELLPCENVGSKKTFAKKIGNYNLNLEGSRFVRKIFKATLCYNKNFETMGH